jgi:hypothetical protein
MADLGVSASAIGKRIGSSHNMVIKYLRSEVYNDPSINKLVEFIKEKELADLYLLGPKGRTWLHELMDDGKSKMIETIALTRILAEDFRGASGDKMLFMLAARWADDIRTWDKAQHRGPWHYIDWPFKPDGQPGSVQTGPPAMGCSRQRLTSSHHYRKTNGLPKRTTTRLVDGLHWEPDGVTLHVRFCEGPETNGRMVEIIWHRRETRRQQRRQTST